MAMPYEDANAYAGQKAAQAIEPASPFDRLESAVQYLREVEVQAEKLAAHLVGHGPSAKEATDTAKNEIAAAHHLMRRMENSTNDVRCIGERIAHHLSRIADRL